jgi:D-beta-D-heptose 7-phosphate kinase/D-beta-D-heptose 1-phosphate adenosyltransferase
MNNILDFKILVIGDVMLDINYYAISNRKAPEADIPVYKIINTEYLLGGAANVIKNLKNLHNNVEIISVIGNDIYGEEIIKIFKMKDIKYKIFTDESKHTTIKNRIIYNNKIINRHDIEDSEFISTELQNNIYDYIIAQENIKLIIISDYDKGLLTSELCNKIISYSNNNNIFTFVDPKILNYSKYKNCFCFKPNYNEAMEISKEIDLEKIFLFINQNINSKNTIITHGENGIYVNSIENHIKIPKNINVIDVTGAGDIVISVLAYIYLKNNNIILASEIANYIASKSVQYIGNYDIKLEHIDEYYLYKNKIIYASEINKLKLIKKLYPSIIFTNGCFDIFHSAHLKLLNFCKEHNGTLVLGLNSDSSIKKIKGELRPINNINERCELLKNFDIVDYIIIFDDETPYEIIKELEPKILIKGGDYNINDIIGKEFVQKIILFNYINGVSTTNVIKKIIK